LRSAIREVQSAVESDCSASRSVEISLDGLPDDLPIPDICLRYRCSKCGGKDLSSRQHP